VWCGVWGTLRYATQVLLTLRCADIRLSDHISEHSNSHRATLASLCSGSGSGSGASEDGVHGYYLPILLPTLIHEISTRQSYLLFPLLSLRRDETRRDTLRCADNIYIQRLYTIVYIDRRIV
jgi:hypothetical protein